MTFFSIFFCQPGHSHRRLSHGCLAVQLSLSGHYNVRGGNLLFQPYSFHDQLNARAKFCLKKAA